jgi:glycosyltransferase involved in cell wall biosynthesis
MMGRQIMSRADAFVVHSKKVKEQAIQIYHLRDDQVFVVPHGIYDSYFQECSKESARKALGIGEEFVILYFGMIRKYKGIPCLVEAFNRLPGAIASNSRLIIAGEDWGDEKGLVTMIESSPLKERITYRPEFVPDADVAKYFSAACRRAALSQDFGQRRSQPAILMQAASSPI